MTRIHLVRHGETDWNADGRIQGHIDVNLNEAGIQQARMLALRLQNEHLDAVYSSDLQRAWMTADIIVQGRSLPFYRTDSLREAMLGKWQGHTQKELTKNYPELYARYKSDPVKNRPPDGERLEDVIIRCKEFLNKAVETHSEDSLLVVGHSGSIRGLFCAAFGVGTEFFRRLRLDNASLTTIEILQDRAVLTLFNDTGHLRDSRKTDESDEC